MSLRAATSTFHLSPKAKLQPLALYPTLGPSYRCHMESDQRWQNTGKLENIAFPVYLFKDVKVSCDAMYTRNMVVSLITLKP